MAVTNSSWFILRSFSGSRMGGVPSSSAAASAALCSCRTAAVSACGSAGSRISSASTLSLARQISWMSDADTCRASNAVTFKCTLGQGWQLLWLSAAETHKVMKVIGHSGYEGHCKRLTRVPSKRDSHCLTTCKRCDLETHHTSLRTYSTPPTSPFLGKGPGPLTPLFGPARGRIGYQALIWFSIIVLQIGR